MGLHVALASYQIVLSMSRSGVSGGKRRWTAAELDASIIVARTPSIRTCQLSVELLRARSI